MYCYLGRVHTLAMPLVTELGDLYRAVDQGATATLLAKLAVEKSYSAKLDETRNAIQVCLTSASQSICCIRHEHDLHMVDLLAWSQCLVLNTHGLDCGEVKHHLTRVLQVKEVGGVLERVASEHIRPPCPI
jgi:hypothetical protein